MHKLGNEQTSTSSKRPIFGLLVVENRTQEQLLVMVVTFEWKACCIQGNPALQADGIVS